MVGKIVLSPSWPKQSHHLFFHKFICPIETSLYTHFSFSVSLFDLGLYVFFFFSPLFLTLCSRKKPLSTDMMIKMMPARWIWTEPFLFCVSLLRPLFFLSFKVNNLVKTTNGRLKRDLGHHPFEGVTCFYLFAQQTLIDSLCIHTDNRCGDLVLFLFLLETTKNQLTDV